jgi:hypothetical protein
MSLLPTSIRDAYVVRIHLKMNNESLTLLNCMHNLDMKGVKRSVKIIAYDYAICQRKTTLLSQVPPPIYAPLPSVTQVIQYQTYLYNIHQSDAAKSIITLTTENFENSLLSSVCPVKLPMTPEITSTDCCCCCCC